MLGTSNNTGNQYFISYKTGTGGNLIASLLYMLTTGDGKVNLSDHGNSHDITGFLINNYDNIKECFESDYSVPRYKTIKPVDSTKTFIVPDHYSIDWTDLHQYFPNFTGIKILYNGSDIPNIVALVVCKVDIDCMDTEITNEVIKYHTDNLCEHLYFKTPSYLNDQIYNIEFNKILTDQEYTLNFISSLTNKPITESTRNFYSEWVERTNRSIEKFNNVYGKVDVSSVKFSTFTHA